MLLLKKYSAQLLVAIIFSLLFYWFSYEITRDKEIELFLFFILAFSLYLLLGFKISYDELWLDTKHIIVIAIVTRCVLLFMTPNLSDDFYRFYWDGNVVMDGENPYKQIPSLYEFRDPAKNEVKKTCFSSSINHFPKGMNSKYYYSVYPPLSQLVFTVSASISGTSIVKNIICIRLILILFECLAFFMFIRILDKLNFKRNRIWIYALNPLVIIELTGNLHFEGLTLSLMLSAFYLILIGKKFISGVFYGMAICTKLIPLMFVPLLYPLIKTKGYLLFLIGLIVSIFFLFLPFLNLQLIDTFGSSLGLYFQSFEFNASLYYIFRWIGEMITGYNEIGIIGKITPFITIGALLTFFYLSLKREMNMVVIFKMMSWLLLIYFGVASVVHPWYIIYLVCFSVFTGYLFPIVWSATALLSYIAYKEIGLVSENYYLIFIEYALVLIAGWIDIKKNCLTKSTLINRLLLTQKK
jgi:hypothetical protein